MLVEIIKLILIKDFWVDLISIEQFSYCWKHVKEEDKEKVLEKVKNHFRSVT